MAFIYLTLMKEERGRNGGQRGMKRRSVERGNVVLVGGSDARMCGGGAVTLDR